MLNKLPTHALYPNLTDATLSDLVRYINADLFNNGGRYPLTCDEVAMLMDATRYSDALEFVDDLEYRYSVDRSEIAAWLTDRELAREAEDEADGCTHPTLSELRAMVQPEDTYSARVRELEAEGLTTSDAQACADAEGLS